MVRSSALVARRHPCVKRGNCASFTLVEMLVATVILVIMIGILFSITQETSRAWKSTTGNVEVFRNSKTAFDTMTRTLSQATLNTYYDYAYLNNGTNAFVSLGSSTIPTTYARNSDLQIVSGQGSALVTGVTSYTAVTHAVFFQAPLGMSTNTANSNLDSLVNACGFYVAYGPDPSTPSFMPTTPRYRYRLMQFTQPSDNLRIYASGNKGTSNWYLPVIQNDATTTPATSDFVLAENVIALIILPKLSVNDEVAAEAAYGTSVTGTLGTALAPNYSYDSSTVGQGGTLNANGIAPYPLLNSFNQMPPVFQITMVAIDEASAIKLCTTSAAPNAKLGLNGLFTQAKNLQTDLQQLENNLAAAPGNVAGNTIPLSFRVFQTEVAIRGAKWTSDN